MLSKHKTDVLEIEFLDPAFPYPAFPNKKCQDIYDLSLAQRPLPYLQRPAMCPRKDLPILIGVHTTQRRGLGFTLRFPDRKFYQMVPTYGNTKKEGEDVILVLICKYVSQFVAL